MRAASGRPNMWPMSPMHAPAPYRIRAAGPDDLAAWEQYLRRELPANGKDGIFFTTVWRQDADARFSSSRLEDTRVALGRALDEPGWLRIFFVTGDDGVVVGHADLDGGTSRASLHRCEIGLGIAAGHRRRGLAEALMRGLIAWAREHGLAWMDLGVFDGNPAALALYRKLGFREVARKVDAFRVDGTPLTDIAMTLSLEADR